MLVRNTTVLIQRNHVIMHDRFSNNTSPWAVPVTYWELSGRLIVPSLAKPATVRCPNLLKAQFSARFLWARVHRLEIDENTLLFTAG